MQFPAAYDPKDHEENIYSLWEKSRLFEANPTSDKPHFSISMPPPNETGTLHVGHALFLTLQDIIARRARQTGHDVLWLPGTDHAAIATNTLMERQLAEQGTSRHEVGREEFVRRTKQFVGNSRNTINSQIRAMGASCDWSRLRYTLDDALNRCVSEVFVRMYNDGLIYRGNRIVNWDPKLETTVSDDEVDHKAEKGTFYTLQYGPFQIGTARPETKFGDKYVVVHPDDKRYASYKHGDTFEADWINGKVSATLIKDGAADPSFGTGAMTITPWHDRTDFEIAERHGLEKEQIIDFDGKLLPIAGEFAGMSIGEARPKIVEKLRNKGLLVGEDKDYTHNLAINNRGKGLIEPQIKLQWFVDVNRPAVVWKGQQRSLKEVMRAVVEDGDIKIVPKRFEKIYYHWIDNLYDWCISRQIWWGHQVPVWYNQKSEKTEIYVGVLPPEGSGWEQDPDTLDTWFSSALWTWSTLIDPKLAGDYALSLDDLLQKSLDFKTYHPTDIMETGWDILFFWVARMILATTYVTGQVPFKTVYLHGMVRTDVGKKMSKSDPETVIDPLTVIPEYGTDALRLALVSGTGAGNDQRLGRSRVAANRNLCNKLWNIARYSTGMTAGSQGGEVVAKNPADHWIVGKLGDFAKEFGKDLDRFHFHKAYEGLYHFIWDDLADWYIEASKVEPNPPLLTQVLESTLILAHPFAPFVTEAIWRQLGKDSLLASQALPKLLSADSQQSEIFDTVKAVVSEGRRIASVLGLSKPSLFVEEASAIVGQKEFIKRLGRLGEVSAGSPPSGQGLKLNIPGHNFWLDVKSETAQSYRNEIAEQKTRSAEAVKRLEKRLGDKAYGAQAPKHLVAESKRQLAEEKQRLARLEAELTGLEKV